MLDLEHLPNSKLQPLRRAWYDRLVEMGAFGSERMELIQGRLVAMSPQGAHHAYVVRRLTMLLSPALVGRAEVQVQLPLAASDTSEPEPDIAVVAPGDYLDDHPRTAMLVIEVAESSLELDRVKASLYANAGVPDYWIVNLAEGVVEVHRGLASGVYTEITRHGRAETLRPLQLADVAVPVAALLP